MQLVVTDYVMLASMLFCMSMAGIFINRKNIIVLLMSVELMLLSANILFVTFSKFSGDFATASSNVGDVSGQVFVFFILAVAAAEVAIGLAILILLFRSRQGINVDEISEMRG